MVFFADLHVYFSVLYIKSHSFHRFISTSTYKLPSAKNKYVLFKVVAMVINVLSFSSHDLKMIMIKKLNFIYYEKNDSSSSLNKELHLLSTRSCTNVSSWIGKQKVCIGQAYSEKLIYYSIVI